MRAMIMAAGVGNRLMPLTISVPKPMVPIVNIPVMQYGIELLRVHKIKEIIANLHYLPDYIADYFKDGKEFGVDLSFSREDNLLGTAGGVKNNQCFLKNDTFVILSGDALTDIDITKLVNFHKKKGALATIALKRVKEVSQYGVVITDKENKITAFQEKPKVEEALSNLVNTGIYVFEPEIFKLIPSSTVYDFGKELFPKLVELNLPFYGYDCQDTYWCDVGSTKSYLQANKDVINGKVKTTLNYKAIADGAQVGKVELEGQVVIGQGCIVEDGAVIKDSVIWPRSIIKKSAIIMDSVIGNDCTILVGSVVKHSIVKDELCCTNDTQELVLIK